MIDSHTHLFLCEGAEERLLDAAREAGVGRMLNVGLGSDSNPTAIAQAERHEEVFATVGSHPTSAGEFGDELEAEILRLSEHDRVRAIGETGIDHYRETATGAEQRRAFEAQIDIARERGLPVVIHARDKDGETTATDEVFEILDARAEGVAVILHCFLAPWRVQDAIERGWHCSFSGIVTYPKADDLREAAAALPERAAPGRDRRPLPGAAAGSRQAQRAGPRGRHRAGGRRGPRRNLRAARAHRRGQRPRPLPVVRLGQNFLADPNLLDAIVRDAGLGPGDVVLEVGPGEGVLTERLAEAAGRVHAVEIDRGLERALAPVAARPNVDLHWADAMKLDFGELEPAPTRVVANLPYAVATPVILRTIEELPEVGGWTVMVQREIADRLRAAPGSRTYGGPSVLAQLACEVRLVRTVDPAVFRPRPRVESAILRLRRTGGAADPKTRELVRAAFAHRRKSLARSLEHGRPGSLAAARAALAELGLPEDARAEALAPEDFAALSERLR